MGTPYSRAPHFEGTTAPGAHAPNAALLIDFDNVTMGMRSDLAKELKSLLNSDIIKGKVTVQRAYADWRRYPQYIVPLSEASIDLIFAPAYGSSKKNATDIRMAIDGMELIFIRPEIGTYILLTGDSDFSSLVLKLKEYGKYVIGIGLQESSSDILVQNCDEYYSYTSIAGLKKSTDLEHAPRDPWQTVEQSVERMVSRGDVMRSDRLKQVMLEIDPGFDEKGYGFSKFSKFLAEASSRNLVQLKKLENGQYEVSSPTRAPSEPKSDERGRRGDGRKGRKDREDRRGLKVESVETPVGDADPLDRAYGVLRAALSAFQEAGRDAVRDSDVKRKMLELDRAFDETELGFAKFSRFLKQAHEQGVVALHRRETGNFEVSAGAGVPTDTSADEKEPRRRGRRASRDEASWEAAAPVDVGEAPPEAPQRRETAVEAPGRSRSVGARTGSGRRRSGAEVPPPLLEGQILSRGSRSGAPAGGSDDLSTLGLPTDPDAMVRYLSSRYKGVGHKTAEALVAALGTELFAVLHSDPDRIATIVPANRADQILIAWRADYARRTGASAATEAGASDAEPTVDPDPREAGEIHEPENAPSGRRRSRRATRRGARGRNTSDG
jgi:uncharacterized protein (TIGR00288 family)